MLEDYIGMPLERQFVVSVSEMQCRLKPVPHQVGAQVDATIIASAHARKERHVFAHHREIVARIVEVEDALVLVLVFVLVIVVWKQVHADRCAV